MRCVAFKYSYFTFIIELARLRYFDVINFADKYIYGMNFDPYN